MGASSFMCVINVVRINGSLPNELKITFLYTCNCALYVLGSIDKLSSKHFTTNSYNNNKFVNELKYLKTKIQNIKNNGTKVNL